MRRLVKEEVGSGGGGGGCGVVGRGQISLLKSSWTWNEIKYLLYKYSKKLIPQA